MTLVGRLPSVLRCTSFSLNPTTGIRPTLCKGFGQWPLRGVVNRSRGVRRGFMSSARWQEKKYTTAHEWIELSEDGKTGTIGISEYAAKSLGDVVFVELPIADLEVGAGDAIGAVESVKSASDIYAPVAGKIIEANSLLEEKPGTINKGPESQGWIARIEVKDAGELEELMNAEGYRKHTEE